MFWKGIVNFSRPILNFRLSAFDLDRQSVLIWLFPGKMSTNYKPEYINLWFCVLISCSVKVGNTENLILCVFNVLWRKIFSEVLDLFQTFHVLSFCCRVSQSIWYFITWWISWKNKFFLPHYSYNFKTWLRNCMTLNIVVYKRLLSSDTKIPSLKFSQLRFCYTSKSFQILSKDKSHSCSLFCKDFSPKKQSKVMIPVKF